MMKRNRKSGPNTPPKHQDLGKMDPLQRPPIRPLTKSSPEEKSSNGEELDFSRETTSEDSFGETSLNSSGQRLYPNIQGELSNISSNKSSDNESSTLMEDSPAKLDNIEQQRARRSKTKQHNVAESIAKQDKEAKSNIYYTIIIIAVALFAIACGYFYISSKEPQKQFSATENVINRLQENFVNQPKDSMKIIRKSLNKVIDTDGEPKCPAIILFVSSKGAEKTTDCLVHRLAKEVLIEVTGSPYAKVIPVDGRDFNAMDPDYTKKGIDDQLEECASSERVSVFLVKNIDHIPGEAALIMQKYCDHENSYYKRAVIIMTISAEDEIPNDANRKMMNGIARNRLNHTWVDLKSDQFDPLYTRISGFISPVLHESNLPEC